MISENEGANELRENVECPRNGLKCIYVNSRTSYRT